MPQAAQTQTVLRDPLPVAQSGALERRVFKRWVFQALDSDVPLCRYCIRQYGVDSSKSGTTCMGLGVEFGKTILMCSRCRESVAVLIFLRKDMPKGFYAP
jgi:hypothetical protein